jgi:hypothetical protein
MLKKMGLVAGNRWIGLAVIRLTEEWFGGIKIAEASLNPRAMGLHREGSLSTLPVAAAVPHTFSSLTLSQLFSLSPPSLLLAHKKATRVPILWRIMTFVAYRLMAWKYLRFKIMIATSCCR